MFNISQKTLDKLRTQSPKGTRVKLIKMNDYQAPPKGTQGTVLGIDDAGSIMVSWDTGSSLSVVYGEDIVEKL